MNKILTTVLVAATALAAPSLASAQAYPNKPVRLVVPYPPGGGSDIMGRLLGEKVQQALGQQVVVENRTGAAGNIGLEYVAKSAPDGYTLVINPNSITLSALLSPGLFDPVKDFTPILMISSAPIVLGGHPDLPVKTVPELVAYAKANPGKLSYAHCGTGGLQNIAMESLKLAAGIDILAVPYNGCGQPIPDMLSGRVQFYGSVVPSVQQFLQAGQLRAYAISNGTRSELLPNVPTVAEGGYPGFSVENWVGIFGPAGLSNDIVARLNAEFNKALALPDVRQRMASQSIEPVGGTAQKLADAVKGDGPRYEKLLKDLGADKFKP